MAAEDVPVNPNDPKTAPEAAEASEAAQPHAALSTPAHHTGAGASERPLPEARTALAAEGAPLGDDAWIGRVLDDRYRITERLGEGGMGAVFVAEHLKLRKSVAVKVIRAELAGNGEVAARFAREAMATAQFEHPHVASATDFGTLTEGGAYLVMQLVRGENLRNLLDRRGPLPWQVACELLAQVADALSAARGAGIVHRDLKPENIQVETRDDGSYLAKILDFGIAHVVQPGAATPEAPERALTRVGTVMGTPGYMAPEQAVGERVDHRTDLYALGVVLWECLTGKPLWDGHDVMTIITRQLREPVPRPRDVLGDPRFPRALDELVQHLCAREPHQRPDHAGRVRDQLRTFAHQRITPASALAEHATSTWSAARERFLALPGPSRVLFVAASAAVVLALISVVVGRRSPQPQATMQQTAAESATPPADPSKVPAGEPSFTDRAVQLAKNMVRDKEAPPSVPKELEPTVQSLLEGARAADRRRAANKLLTFKGPPHLPAYILSIARLEKARNCRERHEAIDELEELQDPRGLPALQRISDAARTGCGFLRLSDCFACVRTAARDAAANLSKVTEP
ncbi:MAG: serine/threonine-protein kinase [Polyangiales bacterium]